MPRALVLYRAPPTKLQELGPEGILKKLDGASLLELREYFEEREDKAALRRLEALSRVVLDLDGRISPLKATSRDARLIFSYRYALRFSYVVRGERRVATHEVSMEHDVWVRVGSGLVVVFDAPSRRISGAIVQLISLRLFDDPTVITPLSLGHAYAEAIERWVSSKEHEVPGAVIRATFRRARLGDVVLDEVSLKREGLDATAIYGDIKASAHELYALTFVTPRIPEIGRRITCKLDRRGGLLVYTPGLREVDLEVLLAKLEQVLGLSPR